MAIESGGHLLHYRIVEKIGEGGMGVVWKALDTALDRDVAIKVLPQGFAGQPERMARFEREAKLLASLNHPNLAAVYGLHRQNDTRFIAMEFVPGEDLAERIARGALQAETALGLALQIAEALETAHEQGVIHRDLKPANVRVMPDGKIKVLDFGLAKAMSADAAGPAMDSSLSPTVTSAGTLAGVILGTAAYMSPEQAAGSAVDRRADIWAFGVVLLELLTGTAVFRGETVSHVLASVLKDEANLSGLPANTPPAIRRLIAACLQKKPRRRLQAIGDARLVIEDVLEGRETGAPEGAGPPVSVARSPLRRVAAGAGVLALLAVAALVGWSLRPPSDSGRISRLSVALPENEPFQVTNYPGRSIAISRDGGAIAFATHAGLRVRRLDEIESRLLPETRGGGQPIFSADGQWIAFFGDSGLMKVPVDGGRPVAIVRGLPNAPWLHGTWADDGRIVFDTWNAGLRRVSADGGEVEVLTKPKNEWNLDPQALPGSDVVLYFAQATDGFRIEAIPIDGGEPKKLLENASHPRYLASGHLLFVRDGRLMVAPFDKNRLQVTGSASAVPIDTVVDHVNVAAPLPQLAVSNNGTLVYAPDADAGVARSTLVRFDRSGEVLDTIEVPFRHPHFDVAPDGRRVAVSGRDGAQAVTQILDMQRRTLTPLLIEKTDYAAMSLWAPDGSGVYFGRYGTHQCELWFQPIEGGPPSRLVTQPGTWLSPQSVSRDGRYVVYFAYDAETSGDIWYLDMQEDAETRKARPLLMEHASLEWPSISPDGRWIAFQDWEGSNPGLHLQRFPGGGSRQRVSPEPTLEGRWSPDGRELFYRTNDDSGVSTIKVVTVQTEPELRLGEPRALFSGSFQDSADSGLSIAVWPDGESLLLVPQERPFNQARELIVVQNWFRVVEEIAPSP